MSTIFYGNKFSVRKVYEHISFWWLNNSLHRYATNNDDGLLTKLERNIDSPTRTLLPKSPILYKCCKFLSLLHFQKGTLSI